MGIRLGVPCVSVLERHIHETPGKFLVWYRFGEAFWHGDAFWCGCANSKRILIFGSSSSRMIRDVMESKKIIVLFSED